MEIGARCILGPLCTHRCLRGAGCSPHIVVRPSSGQATGLSSRTRTSVDTKPSVAAMGGWDKSYSPLSPLPLPAMYGYSWWWERAISQPAAEWHSDRCWGACRGLAGLPCTYPCLGALSCRPISRCWAQAWGNGGPIGWAFHQQGYKFHTSLDIGDFLNIIIIAGGLDWSADLEMGLEGGGDKGNRPAACKGPWSGILHSTGKPNLLCLIGKSLEICWGAGHRLPREGSEVSVRSTIPEMNWKGWGGAGKQISCHNESPLSACSATVLRCVRIYIHVLLTILQCNETFYLSDPNLCHMLVQTVQLKPRRF